MTPEFSDLHMRQAEPSDAAGIAAAHRDSITSLGPRYYAPDIVDAWQAGIRDALYTTAMDEGEVFFIATAFVDHAAVVLGFSSDYPLGGTLHGTSVYVRGLAARHGIGSRLLALAEAHARTQGATHLQIEASLAGVDFYRAHGFVEQARGETRLTSGHPIACVFMRKTL